MARLWSILDLFNTKRHKKASSDQDERDLFIQYYKVFRELLDANHRVLTTMADMQEKAGGAYVFDQAYIRTSCRTLLEGVEKIIGNLNVLSGDRYKNLMFPYQACMREIQDRLEPKTVIPQTAHTLHLKTLGQDHIGSAGGKFAGLGEVLNRVGLPVPAGFVITAWAYVEFMKFNDIEEFVRNQLEHLDIRDYAALQSITDEIQKKILYARVPPDLQDAVMSAYRSLCMETGIKDLKVALRSSAVMEDIRASFAGQYQSVLNIPADAVLDKYKSILASQFSPRGIFYYKQKEFHIEQMAMAVGVLAMVDARAAGVAYSRNPERPTQDQILINAVWGLGPLAVEGSVPADYIAVVPEEPGGISYLQHNRQQVMLIGNPEGGIVEAPVPEELAGTPCLSDAQILRLAELVRKIESHYGRPQDIEWAFDAKDRLFILQSRPLRVSPSTMPAGTKFPVTVKGRRRLIDSGTVICRGVGAGPVVIVRDDEDMARFPQGGVLVIRHSDPEFAILLKKAAAVVAEIGTPLGHLATVIREYNIPAIFNATHAAAVLEPIETVTVDAVYANVYEGIVEELLACKREEGEFLSTPVVRQLREILELVTPLNLTDPRSVSFSPKNCKTLHDITRFCHETAMQTLFDLSKESHFSEHSAKRLVAGVPLQWWVIDLEDGILRGVKGKTVKVDQIVSIPMQALWKGMTAIPWEGPPPVDTKGFLATVLSASSDSSIEPAVARQFVDRNYILVAKNFCNVSTRLGFHFSTLESYVDEQPNNNYVSFVYTGGGAADDRKSRRARLISRLLEYFDFRVEAKGDSVFARFEGHPGESMEKRLQVLGHIIVHTRQMDMVMYNDTMVDWYYKEILKAVHSFIDLGA